MQNNEYYLQMFHEVKNSVTLIGSYLQLLESHTPQIREWTYWSDIRTETSHLRQITSELSRIRSIEDLHLECTDIRPILAHCIKSFLPLQEICSITWDITTDPAPLMARIDLFLFPIAITNLLKNALEAIPSLGKIHVRAFQKEQQICIHIIDSGSGITADVLPHIFDAFVTTKTDGSGLGLCITHQIIQAHNGSIAVSSETDKGTTFTILLPAAAI